MGVTRAKRSSITNSIKRNDAGAGNLMYPWFGAWGDMLGSNTVIESQTTPSGLALDKLSAIVTESGVVQVAVSSGGPPIPFSTNGGKSFQYLSTLNYGTLVGSFNGSFIGGGNYISSQAGYSSDVAANGWTWVGTGGGNFTFAAGAGGWIHQNLPLWAIPYTDASGVHYIRWIIGAPGSYGVPAAGTWTNTAVGGTAALSAGANSKVAVIGSPTTFGGYGTLYYAGYSSGSPQTANFFMRAVAFSTTGVIITNSVTPPAITNAMQSFVSLGETLILSTADNKLYTSTDGGGTWVTRTSPFPGTSPLAISTEVSGRVIASSGNSGIGPKYYQSADGITWTEFANFSPPVNSASNGVAVSDTGFVYLTIANGNAGIRLRGFAG